MLQDTLTPHYSAPRTRRSYSPQFKVHLVDVCEHPGASVAALAREHGINANILHRWRKEHCQRMQSSDAESARVDHHEVDIDIDTRASTAMPSRAQTGAVVVNSAPAFVAIDLGLPPASRASHAVRQHCPTVQPRPERWTTASSAGPHSRYSQPTGNYPWIATGSRIRSGRLPLGEITGCSPEACARANGRLR